MPSPAESRLLSPRRLLAVLALFVALVGVVVHYPSLSARALSLDDHQFLTENLLIQDPGVESAARFFGEVLEPSTVSGYYTPLTMTSLMIDYAAGGRAENLRPFRRTNLLLHALNGALLVVLLGQLFRQPWVAAGVGLLFVAHPLTVEPTVWLSERKTLLATFFALISLCLYVQSTRDPRRGWWRGAVLAFLLSLLSKPTTIALPFLLILLDWWPLRHLSRQRVLEKWPFFAAAGASVVVTLISHARTAGIEAPSGGGPGQALLMAGRNLAFYLDKIVRPSGLTSNYHVAEPLTLGDPMVLAGVIGVVALAVIVALSLRWTRAGLVGVLFFVLAILPTLGVVRYSWVVVSDKYVYFPAIGLLLLLAAGLASLWGSEAAAAASRGRRIGIVAIVLLLTGLEGMKSREYLTRWSDDETLFRHMTALAPGSPRAHDLLGKVLLREGRSEEAERELELAIEIDPSYASAHANLGNALFARGETGAAMARWREALEQDPELLEAKVSLALALAAEERPDEAIELLEEVLRAHPDHHQALSNLGFVYFQLGRVEEAEAQFAASVRARPDFGDGHLNLAVAVSRRGRWREAHRHLLAALANGSDPVGVHKLLGEACLQLDRPADGVRHYQISLQQDPTDAEAWNNCAVLLVKLGRLAEAATHAEKAIVRREGYLDARLNLGVIRERQQRLEEAREQYRAVLATDPTHQAARQRLDALDQPR